MAEIVGLTVVLRPERRVTMRADDDAGIADARRSCLFQARWRASIRRARLARRSRAARACCRSITAEPYEHGDDRSRRPDTIVGRSCSRDRAPALGEREARRPASSGPSPSLIAAIRERRGGRACSTAARRGSSSRRTRARALRRRRRAFRHARRTRSGSAGSTALTWPCCSTPQGPRWTFEIGGRQGAGLHHWEGAAIATKDLSPRRARSTRSERSTRRVQE